MSKGEVSKYLQVKIAYVQRAIISQKTYTQSSVGEQRPPAKVNLKVESCAGKL
jgi:hypothetical protein